MRKIIVVVWLLLLITSMLGIQTDFVNAGNSEKTIFFDDFESYSVGSYPSSNWILDYDGAGEEYQKIVSNPVKSGSKAFQMLSAQGCWAAVSEHKFNSDAEVIGFEADVWAESYGTEGCGGDKTSVIRVAFWNGGLDSWGRYYADVIFRHSEGEEHQLTSWTPQKWYHVKVILNRKTNTYDVYINGELVADGIKAEHSDTENINAIVLTAGHANTKVVFDNIRVFEVTSEPSEPSSSGTVDLSRGLVAYYSFDHCDARDDSGNGHDGTIYGNPECVDGILGKAFEFDGKDDYIWLGRNENLSPSHITVTAWIKLTNIPKSKDWVKVIRNRLYGYEIIVNNESLMFGIYDTDDPHAIVVNSSVDQYQDRGWHLIAGSFDGTYVRLYVDGKLIDETLGHGTGEIYYEGNAVAIARDGDYPDGYFPGLIDEVRIYNRALSEDEIKALYEQGVGEEPPTQPTQPKTVEYLPKEDLSKWK